MQKTLAGEATTSGCALHSGRITRITVRPAAANTGIRFRRTDIGDRPNVVVAKYDTVTQADFRTVIQNDAGVQIETIEHLLAAFAALGVDNAMVEIDGRELPILDGSALEFVELLEQVGLAEQDADRYALRVRESVTVAEGGASATLAPADGFEISFDIEFPDAAIGQQSLHMPIVNGEAVHELLPARTFVALDSVAALREKGLAQGGSLANAIVVDKERVLNPEGLRFEDEFVRHKMLDALGDLYLCGHPIIGHYTGHRSGHRLTNQLLVRLMSEPSAWELELIPSRAQPTILPSSQATNELRAAS